MFTQFNYSFRFVLPKNTILSHKRESYLQKASLTRMTTSGFFSHFIHFSVILKIKVDIELRYSLSLQLNNKPTKTTHVYQNLVWSMTKIHWAPA